jgi:hypothetical protein
VIYVQPSRLSWVYHHTIRAESCFLDKLIDSAGLPGAAFVTYRSRVIVALLEGHVNILFRKVRFQESRSQEVHFQSEFTKNECRVYLVSDRFW